MTKVKHKDLLVIDASLKYLSAQQTEAWYQIGRNLKKTKPLLTAFQEAHGEIIEKYSEKDKEGKPILVGEGENAEVNFGKNKEKADNLWKELIEEEVEIDFYKFPFSKFGEAKLDATAIEPILDIVVTDE